ncbi:MULTISPECIES: hypothetical protein [Mycobacterium]|uniref:Uncharacterized protein n=2 Tax=Mycobacterium TaxID=1763 RepID=A0A2G5PQJ3_MYCCE|nr:MULTISPECIES: hypothetical protein [Mycobacterium]MCV7232764.1 hypothetical protein [Mycobacterium branderi]ORA40902.1 hypothetical protein BST20_01775 [Mycobacterium branderi]PIB80562.1 hypothetical protein CQY23_03205 [Mycobacterium celatum]BBZ09862.1 hypothetical protein MBRA_00570 [Mycobacterium branderi]
MSLNYGTAPPPTQFGIGVLLPLGLPVAPMRDEETPLPSYVVNGIAGPDDKYILNAIISLHTFAKGNTPAEGVAIADEWAWKAHYRIIGLTPGDHVTLPNGTTAQPGWPKTDQMPVFQPYRDPFIMRYYARYVIPLRFTA